MNRNVKDRNKEIKQELEKIVGMSCDEFLLLEEEERKKIISEYWEKHPHFSRFSRIGKKECVLVRFGTGIGGQYLRVPKGRKVFSQGMMYTAGMTAEDQRNEFDRKLGLSDQPKAVSLMKRLSFRNSRKGK